MARRERLAVDPLGLAGEPGASYLLQASTNLASWLPISTNSADGNGKLIYIDSSSPGYRARYYRAVRLGP